MTLKNFFSYFSDLENDEQKTFFKVYHNSHQKKTLKSLTDCFTGLGFRVLHPVIIESLMVPMAVMRRSDNLLLVLSDPEEVIEEVKVSLSACLEEDNMCRINLLQHLKLPRGFEGELRVISVGENEELCGFSQFNFHNLGGWVSILLS